MSRDNKLKKAMDNIDDRYIEEAANFKKYNKKIVTIFLATAAILIVMFSDFINKNLSELGHSQEKHTGSQTLMQWETSAENDTKYNDATLEIEERNYLQTLIIKIKEWNKDGCYGVVTDARDHDVFKDGDEIFVKFGNDLIKIIYGDGKEVIYYNDKPADEICDIDVGSEISVDFYAFDNFTPPTIYSIEVRDLTSIRKVH